MGCLGILTVLACGRAGVDTPQEATDADAIMNIITYDRPSMFNFDLLDFSIPDTSVRLDGPYVPVHFWRTREKDSLATDIQINLPEPGDTLGSVPWALVSLTKFFYGTLHIIATDTSDGGSQPVRLAKSFTIKGSMSAVFEKVGFDYNTRKGWILSQISDIRYEGQGLQLQSVTYQSTSRPDTTFGAPRGLTPLGSIPEFSSAESLTVRLVTSIPDPYAFVRIPTIDGFLTLTAIAEGPNVWISGFRVPAQMGFYRFAIDVLYGRSVNDTSRYQSTGLGVIFRII
jgi:hypothetical protein